MLAAADFRFQFHRRHRALSWPAGPTGRGTMKMKTRCSMRVDSRSRGSGSVQSSYNRQLNKVLANGGHLYVDGAHPEYSTPECINREKLWPSNEPGEQILAQCLAVARAAGLDIVCCTKQLGWRGEQLRLSRKLFVSHSSLRAHCEDRGAVFCNASVWEGRCRESDQPADYQISQRASSSSALWISMVRRPIVNSRR